MRLFVSRTMHVYLTLHVCMTMQFYRKSINVAKIRKELPHQKTNNLHYAKTKTQISYEVTFRYTYSTIPFLLTTKVSSL